MSNPTPTTTITFRNVEPSKPVESLVHEYLDKLTAFCDDILSCRVTVEVPHQHHRHGNRYRIGVHLGVPGDPIIVGHQPEPKNGDSSSVSGPPRTDIDADLQIAIHEAFDIARRQLRDWVERRRGHVKRHGTVG